LNTQKLAIRLTLAAAFGLSATLTLAQAPDNDGYLFDSRGVVTKSNFGLCWKTNRWTPAMAIAECDPDLTTKPEPVKVAEPAKPAPPAEPPKPAAPKIITLNAKELFDFDKAILKPAAKSTIDREVIAKMNDMANVEFVIVSGHTDRLGSQQYNQKLSERRAEAVTKYLVSKGVDPNKIESYGFGKTQPDPNVKCDDKLPRKKLIACLEPNRRVVIEVKGTPK